LTIAIFRLEEGVGKLNEHKGTRKAR